MRISKIVLVAAAAALAWSAGYALSNGSGKDKLAKAAPDPTPKAVVAGVATLGKPETAKWTATTYEAASAEANKKVLEKGEVRTVTGEVVDVSCYLQLGKRGEAHVACGTKCLMNGQPIGIVDADEDLYILFAEEHHPRRDGQVDLKKVFVPLLAKNVTVTGMMTEMKSYKALFVQAAELGGAVKPESPVDSATGSGKR